MKKAALTFGLFSLVMVATSFTAPESFNNNNLNLSMNENVVSQSYINPDGNIIGNNKKRDFHGATITESKSLEMSGVIIGGNKKLDL